MKRPIRVKIGGRYSSTNGNDAMQEELPEALKARIEGLKSEVQELHLRISHLIDTENRLRKSEKCYRDIFEVSPAGILLADTQTRQLRFANQAICDFLGYSRAALLEKRLTDLLPAEAHEWIAVKSKGTPNGPESTGRQLPCLRKDGGVVYADICTHLIEVDGRMHLLGFFSGINERMRVEAALGEQLHFLQTLIDTLPHPIYYKDTAGRYIGCNAAFEKFAMRKKSELIGRTSRDIEQEGTADRIMASDRELYVTGQAQMFEGQVRGRDGSPRTALFNKALFYRRDGSVGGMVGGIIDITALKRIEQEKALLAAAIQQTPEMVIMTDLAGRIHYVNPAFEQITGYLREEVLGRSPALLHSGKHSTEFYRNLWRDLAARKIWKGRLVNRRKNGTLFEVEATIVPVQRQQDQITDYLAVERDISREIDRERQLRQAQKMEAIGTLAGGIAHDFNNILSAIIGFTEIALYDLPPNAGTRAYLKKVLTAGDRARGLVNQILAFSRATEQESRPIEVNSIVKEAIKLIKATLPSTIAITSRIETSATIMADPTQIHQVLMNLCTNAAHAMQDSGGALTIALNRVSLSSTDQNHHPHLKEGQYARLSVGDTGCGIPPEIIERIFDPFFTTKKQGEGTGMGLSVVHGIVEACGGTIAVHSTPGEGSTFEILLPMVEPPQGLVLSDEPPLCPGSERILFVDDEAFQVELGEQILRRLGYRVTAVSDSGSALALFRQAPDQFDLVITDMTMPGMTGDELTRQIKQIRPQIPVLICTGYSHKLSATPAAGADVAGIAYKPLIMKELAHLIRQALEASSEQRSGK